MAKAINKNGLSRTIDAATKRIVRQRCGFGCVHCGCGIYQYEHVDPTFSDALCHNAEKIVLLCGGCHDRVTRGLLSKETVAKSAQSPKSKVIGHSFGPLDVDGKDLTVRIGAASFTNVRQLLNVLGDDVFSIARPRYVGEPLLINAFMCNAQGQEILRIENNEWQSSIENWDIEVVGKRIAIRSAQREIALVIRAESPSELVIERMSMMHKGATIECREGGEFSITTPDGPRSCAQRMSIVGCDTGIAFTHTALMFGLGGGSVSFVGTLSC